MEKTCEGATMIRFSCPACKAVMECLPHKCGQKIACLKCGQPFQIPTLDKCKTELAPLSGAQTVLAGQPKDQGVLCLKDGPTLPKAIHLGVVEDTHDAYPVRPVARKRAFPARMAIGMVGSSLLVLGMFLPIDGSDVPPTSAGLIFSTVQTLIAQDSPRPDQSGMVFLTACIFLVLAAVLGFGMSVAPPSRHDREWAAAPYWPGVLSFVGLGGISFLLFRPDRFFLAGPGVGFGFLALGAIFLVVTAALPKLR
jgi:hypothetical protein